jgi:hypothetical protein
LKRTPTWTIPVKLKLVRVSVDVGEEDGKIIEVGFAEIEKSGRVVTTLIVATWTLENPLRVLLPVTVNWKTPCGVVEDVVTVRIDVPAPPGIIVVLKDALIPAENAADGMTSPSFTRLLKPAFGVTVTVIDWLPGGWIETPLTLVLRTKSVTLTGREKAAER